MYLSRKGWTPEVEWNGIEILKISNERNQPNPGIPTLKRSGPWNAM